MPKELDDLIKKVRSNLKGKTNPNTNNPYTDSEMIAIATAQFKQTKGRTPGEKTKDWKVIEYFVDIESYGAEEFSGQKDFLINGTAIYETITRNGIKYEADELQKAAHTLVNKPLLKDHRNEVDAIVGTVTHSEFDTKDKAVKFKASIKDEHIKQMIGDGRLNKVSIGATVHDLVKTEADGDDYLVAKGIEFLELSLVPVPGAPAADFTQALSESFKLKQLAEIQPIIETKKEEVNIIQKNEVNTMEKIESDKYEAKLEKADASLKEKDTKLSEMEAKLKEFEKVEAERKETLRKAKLTEYKDLVEKKKATLVENSDSLTSEVLESLITTLKSVESGEEEKPVDEEPKDEEPKKEEAKTKGLIKEEVVKEKSSENDLIVDRGIGGTYEFYRMPNADGSYRGN